MAAAGQHRRSADDLQILDGALLGDDGVQNHRALHVRCLGDGRIDRSGWEMIMPATVPLETRTGPVGFGRPPWRTTGA